MAEFYQRRFGPAFEKPCRRANTIECARWQCQIANECQDGIEPAPASPEGEKDEAWLVARIEQLEAENYALKYAAAGDEDAPGAANAVTVADVTRWQKEAEQRARHDFDRIEQLTSQLAAVTREAEEVNETNASFKSVLAISNRNCERLKAERDAANARAEAAMTALRDIEPIVIYWFNQGWIDGQSGGEVINTISTALSPQQAKGDTPSTGLPSTVINNNQT